MPAAELIQGVVRLEATRLYSWARDYVLPPVARTAVTEAMTQLLFAAATGCATQHGPAAFLARSTHAQLQASVKWDEFYVPASAYTLIPSQTAEELEELCLVFGLIEACAGEGRLSLGQLYSLMHHLRRHQIAPAGMASTSSPAAALTIGRQVELWLLEQIDRVLHVRGDLYDAARAFAAREQARALHWLTQVPSQRRL